MELEHKLKYRKIIIKNYINIENNKTITGKKRDLNITISRTEKCFKN